MSPLRLVAFDRLDRYALRMMAAPLALALVALLMATLLERLLRLFDLAASTGAALSSVIVMAAELVPHYLGLALPMAFTAAVFAASARMSDDNEIDVMLSTGRSMARVAAPYFVLALGLSAFNLYLFGQLQPLSRYDYHVAVDLALRTGWDARLEEKKFIDAGRGFSFSADTVEADGRHLRGVIVERRSADAEEVTTATEGELIASPPGGRGPVLQLGRGTIVRERRDGTVSVARFENGYVIDLSPQAAPFRERGDSASERTLPELWAQMQQPGHPESAAAFHGRLARALLPPLLPLLAVPLGMASRRGRRTPGIVFTGLALLFLHHLLQFGESLASNGRVSAAPAIWAPYALFGLLSLWIFLGSLAWPGDNPVSRAVMRIEALFARLRPGRPAAADRAALS